MQNMYLNSTERSKLANELNLSDVQLRMWFQNRRMRMRRNLRKAAADQNDYPSSIVQVCQYQTTPSELSHCTNFISIPPSHFRSDAVSSSTLRHSHHHPNISLQYAAVPLQSRPSFYLPPNRVHFPPRYSPYPPQSKKPQFNRI